jgi:hypothetical protein
MSAGEGFTACQPVAGFGDGGASGGGTNLPRGSGQGRLMDKPTPNSRKITYPVKTMALEKQMNVK